MASRLSPTRAIPDSHQLVSMKKPTREFSAGRDVEVPKMDTPGPMYRLSEWRFEGPFKSDAKMFIGGPLATFVVGLVGYVLSMTAMILAAIIPGVITSRNVPVPEQYREFGTVIRSSAGFNRESSHSERRKQGATGVVVSSSFGNVLSGEGGLPDNQSLDLGPHSNPAELVAPTTSKSGADDSHDATPRTSSHPRSLERSITAPLTAMPTMNDRDDAGPSTLINRPQFIHKPSSLRRTLKGFKDAMHVRNRRQPSELGASVHMRSASTPSPLTTDDEGASCTESQIQCPSPTPTEPSPSVCSSQSPSESSCSNSTNRNNLHRNKPFIPRLGLSLSPSKQQSSSSPSVCPLSSQKQPKIKPPPLRTTYTYTFLPQEPYEEDEPDERPERTSRSSSPAPPDPSSSSYPRPLVGRSSSLPRGTPIYTPIPHSRNRFPSDPIPVFTPLSPSVVSPALMSITASRQDALLALEGKGKGKGKGQGGEMTESSPVSVPVSITVATTAPVQQHQEQTEVRKESKRCRRTGKFRFGRRSSSAAVSITDDESVGSGVDEFGALRDSVKRNSLPVAGEKQRRVEGGGQPQQRQQHRRTGSLFSFGTGTGSKPPVSGTKRGTWKGISFS